MPKHPAKVLIGILLVIFALAILIWGFDKAFDFSDAGYYVLRYQDAQPVEFGGHMYEHILLRSVLPASLRSLIPLRFLGLLLNLLASTYLAFSLTKVLNRQRAIRGSFPHIFMAVFAGLITSYAGSPSELSYNSLNQFLLTLFAASLLLATSGSDKHRTLFATLSAIPLAIILAVKLPTALGGLIVGIVVLICSGTHRWRNLLAFWFAWLITAVLLNNLIQPGFLDYYTNFYRYLSRFMIYDADLLLKSIRDIFTVNLLAMLQAFAVVLFIWIYRIISPKSLKILSTLSALGIALYITVGGVYRHLRGEMLLSGFVLFWVYVIIGYLILDIAHKGQLRLSPIMRFIRSNVANLLLIAMLLYLPYLGALGSSNPLNWGAKYYYSLLLGGLCLLMGLFYPPKASRYTAFIALYLLFFGVFQYVQHPYRSQPLYLQNNEFRGVKYDFAKWSFLTQTENILARYGFTPPQGIIAVYKHPGLVYALGSHEPGTVLWSQEAEDLYFAILAKSKTPQKPVLLSFGKDLNPDFTRKLERSLNIDFPADYHLVASYPSYLQGDKVYVYFPR